MNNLFHKFYHWLWIALVDESKGPALSIRERVEYSIALEKLSNTDKRDIIRRAHIH